VPELVVFIAVGPDVALLPHTLAHYAALGPDRILLSVHAGPQQNSRIVPEVERWARVFGAEVADVTRGAYVGTRARREAALAAAATRDAWVLIADLDELQAYPRPVREIVGDCERRGCDYVLGELVDRVACGGGFPVIDARPLEEQFPVATRLTANVCGGDVTKVVLAHSRLVVGEGQHYALAGVPCPPHELYVPIAHFKWDAGVFERSRDMAGATLHPSLPAADRWRRQERTRFLRYVDVGGGRLPLHDPLLDAHVPGGHPPDDACRTLPRRPTRPDPADPERRRPLRRPDAGLEVTGPDVRLVRGASVERLTLDPIIAERVWRLAKGGLTVRQVRLRIREALERTAADVDRPIDEVLVALEAAGALGYA
jgi:hypothetical protein